MSGNKWGTTDAAGDVDGPASSSDSTIVLFDGTSGKLIKDSGAGASSVVLKNGNLTDNAITRGYDGGQTIQTSGVLIDDSDNVTIPGDVFTAATVEYGGTSTVTGWSSFTSKLIYVKKIGKSVFVYFNLSGTSDATTISFTLPYTSANTTAINVALGRTYDNTAYAAAGSVLIAANTALADCYTSAQGAWTASGSKQVIGQFWYETA